MIHHVGPIQRAAEELVEAGVSMPTIWEELHNIAIEIAPDGGIIFRTDVQIAELLIERLMPVRIDYQPPTPEEMLAMIERAGEDPKKWESAVREVAAIPRPSWANVRAEVPETPQKTCSADQKSSTAETH
jgi:hypothetical protein